MLLINPKAHVIMTLMFMQFGQTDRRTHLPQLLLIATVFTVNNAVAFCVWALVKDPIAPAFRKQSAAHLLNTGLTSLLAVIAMWMVSR